MEKQLLIIISKAIIHLGILNFVCLRYVAGPATPLQQFPVQGLRLLHESSSRRGLVRTGVGHNCQKLLKIVPKVIIFLIIWKFKDGLAAFVAQEMVQIRKVAHKLAREFFYGQDID